MRDIVVIPEQEITPKIFIIREEQVMLDRDLAEMYGVATKYLKRQVRRNIRRFPEDFMFELSRNEINDLRHHFGTSRWGGNRYLPMVFTEQGVAQLSSVLSSEQAIDVNIQIVRLFTRMRRLLMKHKELILRVEQMDGKIEGHSDEIRVLFDYIRKLIEDKKVRDNQVTRTRIGFETKVSSQRFPKHLQSSQSKIVRSSDQGVKNKTAKEVL